MSSLVITLLLLCTRLSPVRVCVSPYRTEGESKGVLIAQREVCCVGGGVGIKTVCFAPEDV